MQATLSRILSHARGGEGGDGSDIEDKEDDEWKGRGKHTTGGYLSVDTGANRIIGFIRLEIAADTGLG